MTQDQIEYGENQIAAAALAARKSATALRRRISLIGERLEFLGRALQRHPEEVTPTPEPISIYDYREGINALDRRQVLAMCEELRQLEMKVKMAEQRVSMFADGTVQNSDS